MRVIKPLELSVQLRPFHFEGQPQLALGVLIAHPLDATLPAYSEQDLWQLASTHLKQWDVFDEGMPKAFAEYLVYGSYYNEQAVSADEVQVSVGTLSKTLVVTGQREWRKLTGSTEPKALTELPITYDLAYGGEAVMDNPVGIGAEGIWLPQIEHPDDRFSHPKTKIHSAGFTALNIEWLPRKKLWGTYNAIWEKNDAPGFARDIQWQIFQLAPQDQWSKETQWVGGEEIRIRNMHPQYQLLQGTLPSLRIRLFVLKADQLFELPNKFETVWLFPTEQAQVSAYRAQVALDTFDGKEIGAVFVAYEHADSEKKPVTHYAAALEKRLQPEGDVDDPEDLALRPDDRPLSELNPAPESGKNEPDLPGASGALGLGALAVLAKMKGSKGGGESSTEGAGETNVDDAESVQLSAVVPEDEQVGLSSSEAVVSKPEPPDESAQSEPLVESDGMEALWDAIEADMSKASNLAEKALQGLGLTPEIMSGSGEEGMGAIFKAALPADAPTVEQLNSPESLAILLKDVQALASNANLPDVESLQKDEAATEELLKQVSKMAVDANVESGIDPKILDAMNKPKNK